MLTELCQELRNWFELSKCFGTFEIRDGQLNVPELVADGSLQDGQYFRIVGSVFNDGVHKYEPNKELSEGEAPELVDEIFEGAIWLMAIPPVVIDLSERISGWVNQYGGSVSSPYTSESFGGYSYQKASSGQGNGAQSTPTWRTTFADELNRWRKI